MIIFTTIDFLLHRFSYTHAKKHLQRALKAPCRCLKRRIDTRAGRTAIALVQRLRPLLECVSKISETTKYKALKKAKKSKFLCCAGLAGYVIANCFTAAKVRHLFRIGKEILRKY